MNYKHTCNVADAAKFWEWIKNRGGVAVWRSVNLSNPGKSWSAPYLETDGSVKAKQSWEMADQPSLVVADPGEIEVCEDVEVKRFHVAIRRGAQGLSLKCTDASSRRIRKAVAQAGAGAYYEFDYGTQEAVIFKPTKTYSLTEWASNQKDQ